MRFLWDWLTGRVFWSHGCWWRWESGVGHPGASYTAMVESIMEQRKNDARGGV